MGIKGCAQSAETLAECRILQSKEMGYLRAVQSKVHETRHNALRRRQ